MRSTEQFAGVDRSLQRAWIKGAGFTDEELAFRDEVREFFRTALPDSIRRKMIEGHHPSKDDLVTWMANQLVAMLTVTMSSPG